MEPCGNPARISTQDEHWRSKKRFSAIMRIYQLKDGHINTNKRNETQETLCKVE